MHPPFPPPPPSLLTPPPPSRLLLFASATFDGSAASVPLLGPHPTSSLSSPVTTCMRFGTPRTAFCCWATRPLQHCCTGNWLFRGSELSGGVHTLFWLWETGGPKDVAFVGRTLVCLQFDFIVLHDGVWIKFGCFCFFS